MIDESSEVRSIAGTPPWTNGGHGVLRQGRLEPRRHHVRLACGDLGGGAQFI